MIQIGNIKIKMLKVSLVLVLFIFSFNHTNAQISGNGIYFQAIARDVYSNPAKDRKIYVQTTILQTTLNGNKVLVEEHQTNTDGAGVFSLSIGLGTRVGGTMSNLQQIDWSAGPYFLNIKIAITPLSPLSSWDYNKEWIDIGTTQFGTVPYALYAGKAAGIDTKLNISDTSKMLSFYANTNVVNNIAAAVSTKLTVTDTSKMLAPYAKLAYTIDSNFFRQQLATKVNIADSNKIYVTPLQLALKTFDTTSLSNRINQSVKLNDTTAMLSNYVRFNNISTVATSGSYADLTGKPTLFTGSYTDLTNKPTIFSGAYADLTGKPTLFTGSYTDLTNKPTLPAAQIQTDWTQTDNTKLDFVKNKPNLFTGSYTDLTNKPSLFSGAYADLTGTVPIWNQNTTGTAANVTGIVLVANGGTGAPTLTGILKGNGTSAFTAATAGTDYENPITFTSPLSRSTNTISITDADATHRGVVSTGTQSFAGSKTFNSDLIVNNITIGIGSGNSGLNTVFGNGAFISNSTGNYNISFGSSVLSNNVSGSDNIGIGWRSLLNNTSGWDNTSVGHIAMYNNTIGNNNTANGSSALQDNVAGVNNTAIGKSALQQNLGSYNTAIGTEAGYSNVNGSNNTLIGNGADVTDGITNSTSLGNGAVVTTSNTIQLGNSSVSSVKTNGTITAGSVIYPNTLGTNGQVLTSNGSSLTWSNPSGTGISSLNALTGSSQTFAIGTSGTAPAFSSAVSTHTLNIPMASSAGVTAGLLSKTDYDIFNSKQSALTAGVDYLTPTGSAANLTSFPTLNQNTTGNAATATTATNIAGGASGSLPYQTSLGTTSLLAKGTDGQILTLTSGLPIWAAAPATGVTSVAMTVPTGLSVSGSPITSSGTLALSLSTGYSIPTTTNQTNWDAAYSNRITSATSPLSISSNTISVGTIPVANGGTGATTLTGLVKGNGTSAFTAATAGTDYIAPYSSQNANHVLAAPDGSNGTPSFRAIVAADIPTLNQNTTGNAATATTATNIAGGASGSIPYQTGLGATSLLAKGTDGQILTLASGLPSWASLNLPDNIVTSAKILDGEIVNADISSSAAIADSKLATISSSGKVSNSATTATKSNSSNSIVLRDPWGGFEAGNITAAGLGSTGDINVNGIVMGTPGGSQNTRIGAATFAYTSSIGNNNTVLGNFAFTSSSGNSNTAIGSNAIRQGSAGGGDYNTAVGESALSNAQGGNKNTGVGVNTLNAANGLSNSSFGYFAGNKVTTGNYNTLLGSNADVQTGSGAIENATALGYSAIVNLSNTIQLGNTDITNVKTSGTLTAGSITYPNIAGTNGYYLTTNGSSTASWTSLPTSIATLTTPRAIYGNNFDGSANLSQVIASTYGGTGNGFTKFTGPTSTEKTFTLPNANATILTTNATVTVAQGGTGATTLTGIVKGNGTSAFTAAVSGIDYSLVNEVADEATATTGQTSFTLTQTPSANSKVKMYINGIRISNTAYSFTGTTLTYNAANNGTYALVAGDRIQFDYYY